jgi:uncharacterized protein YbcI
MSLEDESVEQSPTLPEGGPDELPTRELRLVTRAMVTIYRDQLGRGPRFAHSHYTHPDAITCFLEGSLTRVEQTLADLGEHDQLRNTRMLFHYADEELFRGAVEAITGRRVVAFIGGIDTGADVSLETFVLEHVAV